MSFTQAAIVNSSVNVYKLNDKNLIIEETKDHEGMQIEIESSS